MSAAPVIGYIIGIGIFSGVGWFLNGIIETFLDTGIYQTNNVLTFFQYIWAAVFMVFLIGGGLYVIRQYNEQRYSGGF